MSEALALQLLSFLIVAFPPLAELLSRLLPDDDADPLVTKVRAILPLDGASTRARQQLEADAARAEQAVREAEHEAGEDDA